MANDHFAQRFQMLAAHHGTRGVIRVRENKHLRLVRNGVFKFFGRQAEFVFRFRCDGNRYAARHTGQRVVAHKARLRDNNLIALAHKAAQRHIDSLAAANGDKNIGSCGVFQVIFAL